MSDIHFGRTDADIIESLIDSCKILKPDLVVISGDLTQRALRREFDQARDFISRLQKAGMQVLAVPGNHDIPPVYTPVRRAWKPFERYTTSIAPLVVNQYVDEEIALYGITTVRASRFAGGRISSKDILDAKLWFAKVEGEQVRFVITHHPLDLPEKHSGHKLIQKAKIEMISKDK